MRILITGSKGFIGRNLVKLLMGNPFVEEVYEFDKDSTFEDLKYYCANADAIFHLAAVLRPEKECGYNENVDLTSRLIELLKSFNNKSPVMFASSIQATLDNPYGRTKRIEENKFLKYGRENGANTYVFRFPNLFGTMSLPNYTSVIATFCYNTIKELPLIVNNPSSQMKFAFIEKVLSRVIDVVIGNKHETANVIIDDIEFYPVGLGELTYYMETLKLETEPAIKRNDGFYYDLKKTFQWYKENIALFER